MRILDDKLVEIVQALADEHRHDVRLEYRGVIRPAEGLDDVCAERSSELNCVSTRNHELGKIDDDSDLLTARRLGRLDRLEIERPQQIPIDPSFTE